MGKDLNYPRAALYSILEQPKHTDAAAAYHSAAVLGRSSNKLNRSSLWQLPPVSRYCEVWLHTLCVDMSPNPLYKSIKPHYIYHYKTANK